MHDGVYMRGACRSVQDVLCSLRGVTAVYRRELQQVLEAETTEASADRYKPQWRWFHFLDSFLRNHVLQKVLLVLQS